jgi:LysR family transcriptional regulator, mexEF-oprN operon transcriptional activator
MEGMNAVRLRELDLNLLRVFLTVYQEKSLTRAGERLNLTQSAVSHALGRLRGAFGDRLFVRRGAAMAPTALAERLFPGLETSLKLLSTTLADRGSFDPSTSTRIFRLGMNDYAARILLPRLMARLVREAPNMRLRVRQSTLEERRAFLEEGTVDLLVGCEQDLGPGIVRDRLFSDRDVVVVPVGHPALEPSFGPEEQAVTPFISLALSDGSADPLHVVAGGGGGDEGRVALVVEQELAIPALVAATGCAARLAGRLATVLDEAAQLRIVRGVWPETEFSVYLYRHAAGDFDPGRQWLREVIIHEGAALEADG